MQSITGIVLAGGLSQRMGGEDKGLRLLAGQPLICYALAQLAPQVDEVVISANRHLAAYQALGYAVVCDDPRFARQGPLSGVLAVMQTRPSPWFALSACDTPMLAGDYVQRLQQQAMAHGVPLACAHDGQSLQPLVAVLHRELLPDLAHYLASGGRKVGQWYARHPYRCVDFADTTEHFVNLNTPLEFARFARQNML
ncbi:molybdenum cofactor guanylyltransferase MobA [Thiorhodospira sibirica]|uniref:molybdenum cofactor guanylyltransferase MobA n=1 Tax=Thiorhodospira sibirica TaxID=154347 RepID=UPI00022C4C77|nr:molybdenum cofactor guanylyltransferase MobA [Thiorhodospira sibirica]